MERRRRPFATLARELTTMAKSMQIIEYDVMMGLISSLMLGLFEFLSFWFVSPGTIRFREIYLVNTAVMGIQFFMFLSIYRNGNRFKTILHRWSLALHPYLIIGLGMAITLFSFGLSDRVLSFVITVFTASFVQIYPPMRRLFFFVFSLVAFLTMMAALLLPDQPAIFLESLRNAVMIEIVGIFYTSIQYQSTVSRLAAWKELEGVVEEKNDHMVQMEKANAALESSHRITDAMLHITTEILNTEHLDEVLQLVLDEAIRLIPSADAGSILIKEGENMEFRAASNYDLARLKTIPLHFEDLFQSKQKDLFEPAIIRNLQAFDSTHLSSEKFDGLLNQQALVAKSVLTCSFRMEGQFFGLINLDSFDSEEAFGESDKALIRHLAAQIEITIRIHKLYEKAVRPSKYDDLTQACTRKFYRELVEKSLNQASSEGKQASLVVIDINHFKAINDRFGHEAGDNCLAVFAQGIHQCIPKTALFGRIGGDEFSLLFPLATSEETDQVMGKIKEHFDSHPFVAQGVEEKISFAHGVAVFPADGDGFESLFRIADQRMYQNKPQGCKDQDPR